jgi:hypothetical protein
MTSQPHKLAKPSQAQKIIAAMALIFGVLTVFSGGSVLFGPDTAQVGAGNYVGFVVWFNFVAGGFYIFAAIGLWLGKNWAMGLSALIAILTAVVALGFALVVLRGTPFETRTIGALALRFTFWTVAALVAKRRAGQE